MKQCSLSFPEFMLSAVLDEHMTKYGCSGVQELKGMGAVFYRYQCKACGKTTDVRKLK